MYSSIFNTVYIVYQFASLCYMQTGPVLYLQSILFVRGFNFFACLFLRAESLSIVTLLGSFCLSYDVIVKMQRSDDTSFHTRDICNANKVSLSLSLSMLST